MKKKRVRHEGHMDETWLIPYSDLLTLLLALFIVMFCMSSLDLEKYQQVMMAFSREFNSPASQEGSGKGVGGGDFLPDDLEALLNNMENDNEGGLGAGQGSQIEQLYNSFFGYINEYELDEEMQVMITGDSLLLTLTSDIWFPSGSAVVSASQRETAQKIAVLIKANIAAHTEAAPFSIVITGHTDNVPIHTAQFPSNWYLSATRAINFMEAMLRDTELDPRMFSARGYGEHDPVDTNDTSEGRQRNRRVEVLISLDNFVEDAEKLR